MDDILREIWKSVKKNYYDSTFRGIDIDARYREYSAKLDQATTPSAAFHSIAAFLSGFHDSHLFFVPPNRNLRFDSGYRMEMVGERCFVTQVKPRTDAFEKLHPGDEIAHFQGYTINRDDFHDVDYFFHQLSPLPVEQLDLFAPGGERRTVEVKSAYREVKRILVVGDAENNDLWDELRESQANQHRYEDRTVEVDKVLYWKMAGFRDDSDALDAIFDKARHHPALIIDLRDNPGGSVDTLEHLVGHLFDHDVKIAERVSRKPAKPMVAKANSKPYTGKVIVLINSRSASGSELLARVVQLEHRGTVIGDTSAGAVMESHFFQDSVGLETKVFYGVSITDANLLMADGKSIEEVGVSPDEKVLPSAKDLANDLDPAMSRAAELAGVTLTAAEAGKLFPYLWANL
ncbi:MAG TPA: S41 family peptidase [Edaphobacter sp.]|jgi:C-terminal processing protease CtpA/Prc|nr:S41 family peptidase [Edaphobacter sp.]